MSDATTSFEQADRVRHVAGSRTGHYESLFLRANHPSRPLAFWIRYTLFSPRGDPSRTVGELWAAWFDGETGEHLAMKAREPFTACKFAANETEVAIGAASLRPHAARGSVAEHGRTIAWDLSLTSDERPLLLLPERLYDARLPRAKSLVSAPMARFRGAVAVDGRPIDVNGWVGSRNHNWGSRHTDAYAWAQVAGFDAQPDAFLEVATARIRLGRWLTPAATVAVVRIGGLEHRLNALPTAYRAKATLRDFDWTFASETAAVAVRGRVWAPHGAFVGLRYSNPPGGVKYCLNTKIAACELHVTDKANGTTELLATQHRAAFEILTDRTDHGVEVRA